MRRGGIMIRKIIAVIVGILAAATIFLAVQSVGAMVFPIPNDLVFSDKQGVKGMMASFPAAAILLLAIGYILGSFAAGWLSTVIGRPENATLSVIVGVILTFGWVVNIASIPHPLWMAISGFFLFVPFTILGYNMAKLEK